METELLYAWTSWRPAALWPGGGRASYGVQRVCRVAPRPLRCMRSGRRHGLLRGVVAAGRSALPRTTSELEASPFHGEGYRKAWAKLRVAGMRTSKERVRPRARPPSPAARGPRAWAEGARRDHHHRGARRDVGHSNGRRGGGLRLRGRRSLRDRMHRAPCRQAREPLRGPGADPPGHPSNASGASAKAWPVGCVCATTTARTTWLTIFNRRSRSVNASSARCCCGCGASTIEELRLALLSSGRTTSGYRQRDLLGLDAAA